MLKKMESTKYSSTIDEDIDEAQGYHSFSFLTFCMA